MVPPTVPHDFQATAFSLPPLLLRQGRPRHPRRRHPCLLFRFCRRFCTRHPRHLCRSSLLRSPPHLTSPPHLSSPSPHRRRRRPRRSRPRHCHHLEAVKWPDGHLQHSELINTNTQQQNRTVSVIGIFCEKSDNNLLIALLNDLSHINLRWLIGFFVPTTLQYDDRVAYEDCLADQQDYNFHSRRMTLENLHPSLMEDEIIGYEIPDNPRNLLTNRPLRTLEEAMRNTFSDDPEATTPVIHDIIKTDTVGTYQIIFNIRDIESVVEWIDTNLEALYQLCPNHDHIISHYPAFTHPTRSHQNNRQKFHEADRNGDKRAWSAQSGRRKNSPRLIFNSTPHETKPHTGRGNQNAGRGNHAGRGSRGGRSSHQATPKWHQNKLKLSVLRKHSNYRNTTITTQSQENTTTTPSTPIKPNSNHPAKITPETKKPPTTSDTAALRAEFSEKIRHIQQTINQLQTNQNNNTKQQQDQNNYNMEQLHRNLDRMQHTIEEQQQDMEIRLTTKIVPVLIDSQQPEIIAQLVKTQETWEERFKKLSRQMAL